MEKQNNELTKEELMHLMPQDSTYRRFGSSTYVFYNDTKYKKADRQANAFIWALLFLASILIGAADAVCTVLMGQQTKLLHAIFLLICLLTGAVASIFWNKMHKSILKTKKKTYVYAGVLAELFYQVIFYVRVKEGKYTLTLPGRDLKEYEEKTLEEFFKNLPYKTEHISSEYLIIDATDESMLKVLLPCHITDNN